MSDIFSSVREGDVGEVRRYLDAGGDPNARDNSPLYGAGNTLLHDAAHSGNLELVELLLSQGADVNVQCEQGFTPLIRACSRGHEAIVRVLLAAGADPGIANFEGYCAIDRVPGTHPELRVLLDQHTKEQ